MILTNLLPAIEAKWPQFTRKLVRIQQDNATPHPRPGSDERINVRLAEMRFRGWDIKFVTQPPNSPDCNTLDLAFFRAIQSIQHQLPSTTIDSLIANVIAAYQALPLDICIKVWTTAQMVMNQIILANGNNNYKLPHAGKDKIVRLIGHSIPDRLPCMANRTQSPLYGTAIVESMMAQGA